MERASISRIEEWDSRPVSGGYAGLNELADAGFTGAVSAGGTRLVMLNGRVVGVFDGDISDFDGADATAYEAPDPSLPLLFAMWERNGEVRGQYYTDDTPIHEVDETLASGGFTGYLELAENVLSGDYYLVYYGGQSLSVAFVGNNRRVVTGDEAFDLAADEVGIYEVRAVDLEVTDVPEPSGTASAGAAATSAESGDSASVGAAAAAAGGAAGGGDGDADEGSDADVETPSEAAGDTGAGDDERAGPDAGEPVEDPPIAEAEPEGDSGQEPPDTGDTSSEAQPTGGTASVGGGEPTGRPAASGSTAPSAGPDGPGTNEPDERFEEEARWREARTVPALDPEDSEQPAEDRPQATGQAGGDSSGEAPQRTPVAEAQVGALQERLQRLESELESSERERRQLNERLEEALDRDDGDDDERDALQARIEELEDRLKEAQATGSPGGAAAAGGGAPASRAVDPETALDQTDLFVRYGSKGKATLQTAHDGQADAGEVGENLRIETHSRFDTDTATVGGRPFDDYLEGTIQYRFVSWLIEELLYEIQDTGTEAGLRALYDVLPNVDRAEFNGEVSGTNGDGEDTRESFDVVCRDRMGKPLVVANINDSLDPATGDMMVRLVEDGTAAAEAHDSIGAAFFVTASFFEPDALETVADATRGGGLLSRDSKKSFVKLTRNGGYHLCLVEARGDDFHVAVPEF